MTTRAQMLASDSRRMHVDVRFNGLAPYLSDGDWGAAGDARYRWCVSRPAYASSQPAHLHRPYLVEPLPELLSEEIDPAQGGVPSLSGCTVRIADKDGFFTSLVTTDAPARTILSADISAAATSFNVAAGSQLSDSSTIYIGAEEMRVTELVGNAVTVTRGWGGTDAYPHYANDRVYTSSRLFRGMTFDIVVSPADASDDGEEQIIGSYVVEGISLDETFGCWEISGTSLLRSLHKQIPRQQRQLKIRTFDAVRGVIEFEPDALFPVDLSTFSLWSPGVGQDTNNPPIDFYLMADSEIIGMRLGNVLGATASNTVVQACYVSKRGVLGSKQTELKPGTVLKEVLISGAESDNIPSSFRWSPSATDPFSWETDPSWVRSPHMVDLMLNILTSPHDDSGIIARGQNYDLGGDYGGNWSCIPGESGFGAGISSSRIDFDSFGELKARTPRWVFPQFVLGEDDTMTVAMLLEKHFLKPMGCRLIEADGQIRIVRSTLPLLGTSAQNIDHTNILVEEVDRHKYRARVKAAITAEEQISGITYVVGRDKQEITFLASDYEELFGLRGIYPVSDRHETIAVPGGDPALAEVYGAVALARLWKTYKPHWIVDTEVDIAAAWDLFSGDYVELTFSGLPNLRTGLRGWTGVLGEMFQREHQLTKEEGFFSALRILAYAENLRVGRIAPCAYVTGVASNVATVEPNRYTSSDATLGLPQHDLTPFVQDDVLILLDHEGNQIGTDEEEVSSVNVGSDEITLSGNFSGALAANTILCVARFDDAFSRQTGRYSFAADRATQTTGTAGEVFVWSDG